MVWLIYVNVYMSYILRFKIILSEKEAACNLLLVHLLLEFTAFLPTMLQNLRFGILHSALLDINIVPIEAVRNCEPKTVHRTRRWRGVWLTTRRMSWIWISKWLCTTSTISLPNFSSNTTWTVQVLCSRSLQRRKNWPKLAPARTPKLPSSTNILKRIGGY